MANRNVSMQEYKAAEHDALQHLADIISNYIDNELINFGDGVREGVALQYLKHYAPFTCKDYVDPRGGICNKISQQNACIKAVIINMAKSICRDADETWTDKIEQHVLDKVKVNDMSIVIPYDKMIPYDKDTHQSEFQDVTNKIGISLELLFSVGHLIVNSQVNYHYIETGKSLNVVAASAPAAQLLMSDQKEFSSEAVNYLGQIPHGQSFHSGIELFGQLTKLSDLIAF
jgi:hypothetical protein